MKDIKKIYSSVTKLQSRALFFLPNFLCTSVGSCCTRVVSYCTRVVLVLPRVVSCCTRVVSRFLVLCRVVTRVVF